MKIFFSIMLFLAIFSDPSITEIRKLYATATSSEANAKDFVAKLNSVEKNDDKALVAYKGASIAIASKLEKKVSDKSKKFKEGARLIEYAIQSEPNNIEIHLIRLSVQENVPKIVHYSSNKKVDKQFLLDHYAEQTGALKIYIADFIQQSKSFSATEKQVIK